MFQDKIFLLKGKVQHYSWGGYKFIPQLLNIENNEHKPFAEYWMGAHPSNSSTIVVNGNDRLLNELINENPEEYIGDKVFKRFGELPYLFKILDVRELLSIQVHPSKTEAEKGFDAEEAAGIAITDKSRNYKDRNHKPEVMVALSEFWLLHGFLIKEKLEQVLSSVPEFETLIPIFKNNGYKGLYQYVMELPQDKSDELLKPLVQRELQSDSTDKSKPGFWVRRVYEYQTNKELTNIDRGIYSIYFFNIVKVLPGQAIFQSAGIPHAYMEGQNVELMANSDNVLRGGLTPKHIDVPELLKHTKFEGVVPNVINGNILPDKEKIYPCPVPDFGITKIEVDSSETIANTAFSAEIIIVTEGEIIISNNEKELKLSHGEAAFILPETKYAVRSSSKGIAYKAFVPEI
ncbi:MAG: mannose-6-phosphate isomerase, class I [Arachidicoccus sp.]|nr:mannose-6-phosphate isomerase, class I [Arachidicoccus sp.]